MTAKEEAETASPVPESTSVESAPPARNAALLAARASRGLHNGPTASSVEIDREGARRLISGRDWQDRRNHSISGAAQAVWVAEADQDAAFKKQRLEYQAALRDGNDLDAHKMREGMDASMRESGLDYVTRFEIWKHLADTAFDPKNQPEPKRVAPERHIRRISVVDPDKAGGVSR